MFSNFASYYDRLLQGRHAGPLADDARKEYSEWMLRIWGTQF